MAKPQSVYLDVEYDDSVADQVDEFDKVWTAFKAHVLRRAAHANRHRHSALSSLDLADQREKWDGTERRHIAAEREAFGQTGLAVV